jgi:predicted acylesterase/phospholipase RssA
MMIIQDDNDVSNESPLFLVLDGGGARGIAHVAMWKALERLIAKPSGSQPSLPAEFGPQRYRLSGVAGTSAGAIAAAFIAAGASARDLIDKTGRSPLCTPLGLEYFHALFGIRGMRRIKSIRRFQRLFEALEENSIARFGQEVARHTTSKQHDGTTLPAPDRAIEESKEDNEDDAHFAFPVSDDDDREDTPDEQSSKFAKVVKNLVERLTKSKAGRLAKHLLDPLFAIPILVGMSPLLYFAPIWLIDRLNHFDFKPPYSLLLVVVSLYVSFTLTSWGARLYERHKTRKGKRGYHWAVEWAAHPLASFVFGLGIATIVSLFTSYFLGENLQLPAATLASQILISEFLAWSVFALACGYACLRYIRNFIKGGIDPKSIENDLNQALRALLTQVSGRRNGERHEWAERLNLNERQKFIRDNPDYFVTFSDIYETTQINLTVVAADTIKNRIETFSCRTHGDMHVATAVTASLAIPFVFRPVRREDRVLVDGGLVSSIPAWVFRRDRNRDPDSRILAVRIEPSGDDTWIPQFLNYRDREQLTLVGKVKFLWRHLRLSTVWPFRLLTNIISTALFGARALELDASDRLDSITLIPNVGLLDFDADRKRVRDEVSDLFKKAHREICNRLWFRQARFEEACEIIENDLCENFPEKENRPVIRMFWARRDGTAESLRIRLTYNFTPTVHFDDRIVMPYSTSMSTLAYQTRKSQYAEQSKLADLRAGRMNRYRAAVIWPESKWCWAIPVFKDDSDRDQGKEPLGVIAIESDRELSAFNVKLAEEACERNKCWPDPLPSEKSERQIREQQGRYRKIAEELNHDAEGLMGIRAARYAEEVRKKLARYTEPDGI